MATETDRSDGSMVGDGIAVYAGIGMAFGAVLGVARGEAERQSP